jgi:hypothetical protein
MDGLFTIIDVSNPVYPVAVASCHLCLGQGIFVTDKYAYIAELAGGSFYILYIFDPAHPFPIGFCDIGYGLRDVFVSGNYAYIANESGGGIKIVDISNPFAPSLISFFDTHGGPWGIFVSNNYAFIADIVSGFRVIDISDPTNPLEDGFYDIGFEAWYVYVSGSYAYVVDGADGLYILDISYFTGIEENETAKPEAINISVFPNPFNSAVRISVSGVGAIHELPVRIEIYDIGGKRVFTAPVGAGLKPARAGGSETLPYEIIWRPAAEVPSGVYLVRAKIGNSEITKRVVYLK